MRKFLAVAALSALLFVSTAFGGTLTAIHGIPGDSLGLDRDLPVDVYVNEGYAFTFSFPEMIENIELPAGEYLVEVYLAGSDPAENDAVLSATAEITEGGNFTIVAHLTFTGDPEAPGIALTLFENETSPIYFLETRLTARHLANAPTVTLDVQRFAIWWAGFRFPGFANPNQVVFDGLAGPHTVNLLAGGQQVFTTGRLQLSRGKHYLAYAVGDFFTDSFQLLLQVID